MLNNLITIIIFIILIFIPITTVSLIIILSKKIEKEKLKIIQVLPKEQ